MTAYWEEYLAYVESQEGPDGLSEAREGQEDLFGTPSTPKATIGNPEPSVDNLRPVSLPEDEDERNRLPIFDGFLAFFPNATAEVAKLSYLATQQHHPDASMHWDRSKSLDHRNKIARHLIDAGKVDDKGIRHSAGLAWRAMALLQEELERDLSLPPSPASKNRQW